MGSEEAEGLEGGELAEGRWEGGGGGGSSFNFLRGTSVLTNVGGALMHHAVMVPSSPSTACGEMLVIENPIGNPIIGPNRGIQWGIQ